MGCQHHWTTGANTTRTWGNWLIIDQFILDYLEFRVITTHRKIILRESTHHSSQFKNLRTIYLRESVLEICPNFLHNIQVNHTWNQILGHQIDQPRKNHSVAFLLSRENWIWGTCWSLDGAINKISFVLGIKSINDSSAPSSIILFSKWLINQNQARILTTMQKIKTGRFFPSRHTNQSYWSCHQVLATWYFSHCRYFTYT